MKKYELLIVAMLLAWVVLFASVPTTYAAPAIDGVLTDSNYYLIDDNTGGPTPGFGVGHEINALYTYIEGSNFYIGIAGDVQVNNRILLFIDSIGASGYSSGDFGRLDAPAGIANFNFGTQFDPGFLPDYVLVIGSNTTHDNFYWDLYTLSGIVGSGGGPNNYLGDISAPDLAASPGSGTTTHGFEMRLDIGVDLVVDQNIQLFAAYIADNGFLSNQFISPAGATDGNYGDGVVFFGSASPNPVIINGVTAVTLQDSAAYTASRMPLVLTATAVLLLATVTLLGYRRRSRYDSTR